MNWPYKKLIPKPLESLPTLRLRPLPEVKKFTPVLTQKPLLVKPSETKKDTIENYQIYCRHCKSKTENTDVTKETKTITVKRIFVKGTCKICKGKCASCIGEVKNEGNNLQ